MPILIWFSAISALLQYWGILQPVVAAVGGAVKLLMGTTTVECFVAVANIFLGPVRAFCCPVTDLKRIQEGMRPGTSLLSRKLVKVGVLHPPKVPLATPKIDVSPDSAEEGAEVNLSQANGKY